MLMPINYCVFAECEQQNFSRFHECACSLSFLAAVRDCGVVSVNLIFRRRLVTAVFVVYLPVMIIVWIHALSVYYQLL